MHGLNARLRKLEADLAIERQAGDYFTVLAPAGTPPTFCDRFHVCDESEQVTVPVPLPSMEERVEAWRRRREDGPLPIGDEPTRATLCGWAAEFGVVINGHRHAIPPRWVMDVLQNGGSQ